MSAAIHDAGLLFDAEFLRKLERLELLANKIFRGLIRGEHTTPRRGRGIEFADFRRYRPGDDLRVAGGMGCAGDRTRTRPGNRARAPGRGAAERVTVHGIEGCFRVIVGVDSASPPIS